MDTMADQAKQLADEPADEPIIKTTRRTPKL
jgi:hypothetical protein